MAHQGRRQADDQLRMALAFGATVESAAQNAGISVRTAHRRLKDPQFHRELQDLRTDLRQRTSATMLVVAAEAVKTLRELQKPDQKGSVRLGAARAALEFAMKLDDKTEFEQRIVALEEQYKALSTSS